MLKRWQLLQFQKMIICVLKFNRDERKHDRITLDIVFSVIRVVPRMYLSIWQHVENEYFIILSTSLKLIS